MTTATKGKTMRKQWFALPTVAAMALLAAIAAATDVAPAAADRRLTPHIAEYKLRISVLSGRLETELRRRDSGYVATHRIEPTGLAKALVRGTISAESTFAADDAGLRPTRYVARDKISGDRLSADIRFDWDAARLRGSYQTKDHDAPVAVDEPLDALVFDAVSIQYKLMHDLMTAGAATEYLLHDVDELKRLTITNIDTRRVRTPAGEFDAIGIRHQTANSSRQTTLWCAAELDYLPVVIERHRKGKLQMRAQLKRYEPETVNRH